MILTRPSNHPYRSLHDEEVVRPGDIVEDLLTGKKERVVSGYYSFLTGHKASNARQLPGVFDIVRHRLVV